VLAGRLDAVRREAERIYPQFKGEITVTSTDLTPEQGFQLNKDIINGK
jgi:hypothetical protein